MPTTHGRLHPKVVIRRQVACQSERTVGAHILLIVLHDTEGWNYPGTRDLAGLGDYFNVIEHEASAHVGVDRDGTSGIYVNSRKKAWHCAHYNSAALGIEQIGFATDQWASADCAKQLKETARWIARWSLMYAIPVQRGAVSDGAVTLPGVLRHSDLGALGGGHSDPGTNYPFDAVLKQAREIRDAIEHH